MDDAMEEATLVVRQTTVEDSTVIGQLLETLKQLQTQDRRSLRGHLQRRARDLSGVECCECHRKGHIRRRCLKLTAGQGNKQ